MSIVAARGRVQLAVARVADTVSALPVVAKGGEALLAALIVEEGARSGWKKMMTNRMQQRSNELLSEQTVGQTTILCVV